MHDSALREQFASYDRDGDGYIDRAEFGELLDALDADKNGQIDFSEFKIWWTDD